MKVKIGVTYSAKELVLDVGEDASHEALRADVAQALADEGGMLWLTDEAGRVVGVPADRIAYVELGSPDEDRRIGFGVA